MKIPEKNNIEYMYRYIICNKNFSKINHWTFKIFPKE